MKRVRATDRASGSRGEGSAPEECTGRIRVRKEGRGNLSVELSGELDVAAAGGLREILGWASASGRSVAVDLSGVSFLDSACLRELVVSQRLRPGRVILCNPSPQVELSAAACGVEACIRPCSTDHDRSEATGVPGCVQGEEIRCW
jgi:anti-anti-sigma factor